MTDSKEDIYRIKSFKELVRGNPYPGRGIIAGESADHAAVAAYFVMGRSENSRNRVLACREDEVRTETYDASISGDHSLTIYTAVKSFGRFLVIANGDQSDTIIDGHANGTGFYSSLESRQFEPDAPNFTPRISAELEFIRSDRIDCFNRFADTDRINAYGSDDCDSASAADGGSADSDKYADRDESNVREALCGASSGFVYRMSILKSADADGSACERFGFEYRPLPGSGHFIHTYERDGSPLPPFTGEPRRVAIPGNIDEFANGIWTSLDAGNRVALYVRYIDIRTGASEERLINSRTQVSNIR